VLVANDSPPTLDVLTEPIHHDDGIGMQEQMACGDDSIHDTPLFLLYYQV
jgi:hypothetical protein